MPHNYQTYQDSDLPQHILQSAWWNKLPQRARDYLIANQHKENQCPTPTMMQMHGCGSVDRVSPCRQKRLIDSIALREDPLDLLAKQMVSNVVSQSRC